MLNVWWVKERVTDHLFFYAGVDGADKRLQLRVNMEFNRLL